MKGILAALGATVFIALGTAIAASELAEPKRIDFYHYHHMVR